MKGIIIAGGTGTRLSPLTRVISKSLLPVYDKPMIYYPLSVLMQAGINEILIITTPNDKPRFIELLGDGSQLGISLSYEVEPTPKGIAQAFILGEKFIGDDHVALILGDNIFYGHNLHSMLRKAMKRKTGATIFGYFVNDPERFGVVEFNDAGKVFSIEEKPLHPKTNYAVTGLYFYDNRVVEIAKKLKPSARGELEITDINKTYLDMDEIHVELLGEEYAWIDTGTHNSLYEAARYIKEIENQKNIKIGCIEEIAYKKGFISKDQLKSLAHPLLKSDYGKSLMKMANLK
ncbi:glucose-1-phosphate thymidylyltransferase RfbA [Lederbergia citrea]|uniref:Glucose-1-phosphate thymidylyltransferase n=1 Tax=Lederbergia citrea TaxID=2833581 RepID=A0A942UQC3_9BACI|nr:glucose-1-phosphate thymidylyltransferase RfbA [Lederbergia citrea]MBS4176689.1 glucose-1-phosphate thymidylyltransferase RfbA [Lederbergia citrea]MBS4203250.1 glucose-1-phosphate thymidylyltransferase RfbA [Lederbergia citrea]MBS4222079.1 glucose-1-phosphate thymidylyltransferase RfbA [Lederbergia citrea]